MAYSRMETLLRLPFAQSSRLDGFRSIIDVPLIARKSATGACTPCKAARVSRVPGPSVAGRARVRIGISA
jgi:hypothetical protein